MLLPLQARRADVEIGGSYDRSHVARRQLIASVVAAAVLAPTGLAMAITYRHHDGNVAPRHELSFTSRPSTIKTAVRYQSSGTRRSAERSHQPRI